MIGSEILKCYDAEVLSLSDQLIEIVHVIQVVFVGITVDEGSLEFFQSLGIISVFRECFLDILEIGLNIGDYICSP